MKSSILILHAGALGDCVLTLYVAMALRKAGHTVTVAARSPIAKWAARRGVIDASICLDRLSPLLWGAGPDSAELASDALALIQNFDRVISFLGGPDQATAKRLTDRFGPDRVIHVEPRPSEKALREGTHITQQWVEEIGRQGLDFNFEISNLSFKIPCQRGHVTNSKNIIIHPGSGGLAKCCPLDAMEALMREFLARGWRGCWMIGPDEVERDGPEFRRRLERSAPVVFEESIEPAADLVVEADAFVGNDSGMTHVAALAGVNTVALFGPTDPRVWRPPASNCLVFRFPSPDELDGHWTDSILRMIA